MECATGTFFILFDKARKRWMSCINSIWVTKIGIDGLNGEDCSREGKPFSLIISAQEFQALPSFSAAVMILRIQKRLTGEY